MITIFIIGRRFNEYLVSTKEQVRPNLLPFLYKSIYILGTFRTYLGSYGTTDVSVSCLYLERCRFYLTFCNIPVLAENQPFQQFVPGVFWCWWYVLIYCPFYTNADIDIRYFVMRSWHFPVLFDMRYMMIRLMVVAISSFLSKGHDTVSACISGE